MSQHIAEFFSLQSTPEGQRILLPRYTRMHVSINVPETLEIQINSQVFIYFILQSVLHEPKRNMGEPECGQALSQAPCKAQENLVPQNLPVGLIQVSWKSMRETPFWLKGDQLCIISNLLRSSQDLPKTQKKSSLTSISFGSDPLYELGFNYAIMMMYLLCLQNKRVLCSQ